MTISAATYEPDRYTLAGSSTQFTITWSFGSSSDVIVVYISDTDSIETTLVLNSNYTISGQTLTAVGDDPDGNDPWDNGILVISRATPLTQSIDYRTTGAFTPEITEDAFDKLTRSAQEREDDFDRSLRVGPTVDMDTVDTELPSPQAGYVFGWNDDADAVINKVLPGLISVSTWAQTFLDDTSASEAMNTLTFSTFFKTLVDDVSASAMLSSLGMATTGDLFVGASDTGGILPGPSDDQLLIGDSSTVSNMKWKDANSIVAAEVNASGTAPMYVCRAWVNFNGTGTVAIRASGNVSSITDNGTGNYTVNFTTAMPDANYAIVLSSRHDAGSSSGALQSVFSADGTTNIATTSVVIETMADTTVAADSPYVAVAIFR